MYRRPKFLEILLEIRQEMARQADYDVDLFAEMVRGGKFSGDSDGFNLTEPKIETNLNGKQEIKTPKSQIADRKS
jgi:hypothetical protein